MKTKSLYLILITLLAACSQPTSNQIETEISPINPENIEAPSQTTITVSATRIGGSGTGVDIVVRNDNNNEIFILGENKKIYRYKYNTSSDKFNQYGGGTGKRISATSNKLLLCGSNNKVYQRNMSSTGSWSYLGSSSSECRDIVGSRSASSLTNGAVAIAGNNGSWWSGYTTNYVYRWNGSGWSAINPNVNSGGYMLDVSEVSMNNTNDVIASRATYEVPFVQTVSGSYFQSTFSDWNYIYQGGTKDVSAANSGYWRILTNRQIHNVTTNTYYTISGNRDPDRLAIANDGTVYFIDEHTRGIYRFNP